MKRSHGAHTVNVTVPCWQFASERTKPRRDPVNVLLGQLQAQLVFPIMRIASFHFQNLIRRTVISWL